MPVSAAITFRMAMGSGYVAVMRGTPVTPVCKRLTPLVMYTMDRKYTREFLAGDTVGL